MKNISDLNIAEEETLLKVKQCITTIRNLVVNAPSDLQTGINILERLRNKSYEDINQIQHEAMILRAVRLLESSDFAGKHIEWQWNPQQTGLAEEPDLSGKIEGKIEISAEITTSKNPIGTIDQRMKTTLNNLSKMSGKKYYFVHTQTMEKRAKTKVGKSGYKIEVIKI